MAEENLGLMVVIPTRNRAALAIAAIRSVLSQNVDNVRVLVSDNSTTRGEAARLSRYCRRLQDKRLSYVASPESLQMSRHWDWAMNRAFESDATHFTVLTDRMVFRPGELRVLWNLVQRHPAKTLSYKHDKIVDSKYPVTVELQPWTGGLFEISCARLLKLSALTIMHESLPRMLNCVVPRTVLKAIENRFGIIFGSIAPDFNLCYKALEVEDVILYYDKAILIHRALKRSNGETCAGGFRVRDHADFLASMKPEERILASPVPLVRTRMNFIMSEYCLVGKEAGSAKFPEIDMERYLNILAFELENIADEDFRNEMMEMLVAHGWTGQPTSTDNGSTSNGLQVSGIRPSLEKLVRPSRTWLRLLVGGFFAREPAAVDEVEFRNSAQALAYAFKHPQQPIDSFPYEESTLEYKQIEDRQFIENAN